MFENNKNTKNLVENLELFLRDKKISYSVDGSLFLFKNLTSGKLIEILNYIQLNNIQPNEIKITINESILNLTIEVAA
jgi:hypothetical protein